MRLKHLYFAILSTMAFSATAPARAADAPASQTISADDAEKDLLQSWSVGADARVEIDNVRGSVSVTGWDQPQVQLTGSLGPGSKLEISADAQHLKLQVRGASDGWFGGNGPRSDSDLVLKVPSGAQLKVGVVSADANISGMRGKSLDVSGVSGKLTLSSDAPEIDVNNVSGDIVFTASRPNSAARTHLQTVSGDVDARSLGGRVKLETVSGNIGLDGGEVQELETGTVSGDAKLLVTPAVHARFNMSSMSGDIRMHLPPTLSGHVEAKTFSGDIHSDFGKAHEREHGSGSTLDARIGDGDAEIKAESFSGSVELRKQ
jgi:DUF4097 and DUF4098 domain-containing protein YvlB